MGQVLIVEDNMDISVLYQRALFNHEHIVVPTAEDAVDLLATHSFDLIILDMHLPEDSGLSVLRYLRHELGDKNTPVFAISADDLMRYECQQIGIQAWMTKPIELDELMITASRLIEEYTKSKR